MRIYNLLTYIYTVGILMVFAGCAKDETSPNSHSEAVGNLKLQIDHKFGDGIFTLNDRFINDASEELRFKELKYYISNISLENVDGTTWIEEKGYHLIDLSAPGSLYVELDGIPEGSYQSLTFTIGIESNPSEDLKSLKKEHPEMYWSSQEGFIFIRINGRSNSSSSGGFQYLIGGSGTYNAVRKKSFEFEQHTLNIDRAAHPNIHLMADVRQIFDGNDFQLRVAKIDSINSPGPISSKAASNFSGIFEIDHIHE